MGVNRGTSCGIVWIGIANVLLANGMVKRQPRERASRAAGRWCDAVAGLDHAEHDGADEGHCEVRGDNAQFPGERHEVAPSVRAALSESLWLTESLRP
jgi:hypothetical protein